MSSLHTLASIGVIWISTALQTQQKTACEKIVALSLAYLVDYEVVLHGVAWLLHVPNPLKFLLVVFTVHVLILVKYEVGLFWSHRASMNKMQQMIKTY